MDGDLRQFCLMDAVGRRCDILVIQKDASTLVAGDSNVHLEREKKKDFLIILEKLQHVSIKCQVKY